MWSAACGNDWKGMDMRSDFSYMRRMFALLPWRMGWPIVLLILSAILAAGLDMAAVAAMLPLTQLLTGGGGVPSVIADLLSPIVPNSDRPAMLLVLALFVGLAFVAKNIALIGIRWWTLGVTSRATARLQAELLKKYVAAPYSRHRMRSRSAVLQNVTNAVPGGIEGVLLGYITIAVDGVTIIALVAMLVVISPLASLGAIVIFGGAGLLISRLLKPAALKYAHRTMDIETESWGLVNPAIEGFRESRVFGREQLFVDQYLTNRDRFARTKRPQALLGEMPKYLLEIVMIFGILVVALMLFATQSEAQAFGLLAMFAAASIRIIPALNRLVATYNGVRAGRPYLTAVSSAIAELDAEQTAPPGVGEVDIEVSDGEPIVVDNVSFHYPDSDQMVLRGVSAEIARGSFVALVGTSGAGKTTFADILVGLLEPSEGTVSVGEVDVVEHPSSWRREVAMVSQRVYLWEAPVRDLITFGLPRDEVDDRLLAEVLDRARLCELVESMPEGLDTVVGESGARLSGGQAQRIGIARALYAQPKVLVLDEATSALDNETEAEISRTLEQLRGEVTLVVIAHRLSTVKKADEILFFSGGRLAARGTMSELNRSTPEFARLVELGNLEVDAL